uniref:Ribonuclease H protein At1g65750 family n=1 Tax=Cajanus cajan TaxID=3821 RepID=A0A151RKA4_CAJCA|nr:Putative ribonuclease H protein At1g65750 family [Cajanus cajan]
MFRYSRWLGETDLCARCSGGQETILHALRDCPHSHEIKFRLENTPPHLFTSSESIVWFKDIIMHSKAVKLAMASWWIWRYRNNMVFQGPCWSMLLVLRKVHVSLAELNWWLNSRKIWLENTCWSPSDYPGIKVNIDGSWLEGQNRMGFGGVIRDSVGRWLGGFASSEIGGDPLRAELLAIKEGLSFCWNFGYKQMVCEADCIDTISEIERAIWERNLVHKT